MSLISRMVRHARLSARALHHGKGQTPPFMIVFINSICNLTCEHCFYVRLRQNGRTVNDADSDVRGRARTAPVAEPSRRRRKRACANRPGGVAIEFTIINGLNSCGPAGEAPPHRLHVEDPILLLLTLALHSLLSFLGLLLYSPDSSSFSAISLFWSAVRFHGIQLSTSLGTLPPASAHACR